MERTGFLYLLAAVLVGSSSVFAFNEPCKIEEYANYKGNVTTDGATNLQPDVLSCCLSCFQQGEGRCNTYVWCGKSGGCDDGTGKLRPYLGCDLKVQQKVIGTSSNSQPEAYARGQGQTSFTSGTVDYSLGQAPIMGSAMAPSSTGGPPAISGAPDAASQGSVCVYGPDWTITWEGTKYNCIPHADARYCTSNLHPVGYCRHADGVCREGDGKEGAGPCVKKADGTYDNWCC